jgi:hypothetical protein
MEFSVLNGNKFGAHVGDLFCSFGLDAESLSLQWWWSIGLSTDGFTRLEGGTAGSAEQAEAAIEAWLAASGRHA